LGWDWGGFLGGLGLVFGWARGWCLGGLGALYKKLMGSKIKILINLNTQKMFSSLSRALQRILVSLIMLLSLFGIGALVYFLLDHNNHVGVMIVSTVAPAIVFAVKTWVYLRINWVVPDVIGDDSGSDISKMHALKRKLICYVGIGFLLGVPAVYFIMHGVTKDIFATVFPLCYILLMSVASIAFLPEFLKTTRAIAPVRYGILTVALFVILLKTGVYLNSYFPGNLSEFVARNLFFALGCANILLLFLIHAAWHQVFTMEHVVALPLNHVTPPKQILALNQTQEKAPPEQTVHIFDVPVNAQVNARVA